jgi:DNA (cytosine-5)-methyltransferase 1
MPRNGNRPVFIDAFAGCGGLSLGLFQAGLQGLFAIEHDKFAFETLRRNLLGRRARHSFVWPNWLPRKPISVEELLSAYKQELRSIAGSIHLLVGGPPCQGFSSAGRRNLDDPRNKLFKAYLELVEILRPKVVLIENVRGFTIDFGRGERIHNYADKLRRLLSAKYEVYEELLDLSHFGVPQSRTRYFLFALQPGLCEQNPFDLLRKRMPSYLRSLGLRAPVPSWSAISDLEVSRGGKQADQPPLSGPGGMLV